jgi:tRNA(Ile)-lysidine synthase
LVTRPRLTPETAKVRAAVSTALENAGARAGDLVLVACSGGQDSLALAIGAAFVGKRDDIRIGAVVVDHQLQPGSAKSASQAASQCRRLGMTPVEVRKVEVTPSGEGPEAAAREARYSALAAAKRDLDARFVLLGHTLDDQAETVLLGLSRGSGIHSISGMHPQQDYLLRPLLGVTRAETLSVCRAAGLLPWQDPHNLDNRFSRVRVRNNVLPVFEQELGPGIAKALARTAELARADDLELFAQAQTALDQVAVRAAGLTRLAVAKLAVLARPIASRVMLLALRELGCAATYAHISAVLELIVNWHGQQAVDLPGVKVERAGDDLVLRAFARPLTGHANVEQLER